MVNWRFFFFCFNLLYIISCVYVCSLFHRFSKYMCVGSNLLFEFVFSFLLIYSFQASPFHLLTSLSSTGIQGFFLYFLLLISVGC